MLNTIISALVGGLVGVIAFVVIKQVVGAQATSDWTGAEIALITIIPLVIGIITIVGMFMMLSRVRG